MCVYVSGGGAVVASICAVRNVTRREMRGGEVMYCMRDGERWVSDSNRFAISLTRLFIGVSAFCVSLYELTRRKRISCHGAKRAPALTYACACHLQVRVGEERLGD